MFCKHEWSLLSETTTESKFEVAMKAAEGHSDMKIPWQMCEAARKHIQVFKCSSCGKFVRYVEDI